MTPPLRMFALQAKGSIIIIDELLSGYHKVFLTFLQFQMGQAPYYSILLVYG